MNRKKNIFLIGAMGGLGRKTIDELSSNGYHVLAADLSPEVMLEYKKQDLVTPLIMNLKEQDSIDKAYLFIESKVDHLDAIIHMAGILEIGSLVELPIEKLQASMEINLYGIYRVNKTFLPLVLKQKGRILILSSEVGRQVAAPFNGIYSITKHALEAYSDALRRELTFLGIKVIKIQPGPFKTAMTKNAEGKFIDAEKNSVYFKKNLAKGIVYLPKVYSNANMPILLAKKIASIIKKKNPNTVYLVKADIPRLLLDSIPIKWADSLIKKMLS